jgi:hypothetical protein
MLFDALLRLSRSRGSRNARLFSDILPVLCVVYVFRYLSSCYSIYECNKNRGSLLTPRTGQ